MKKIIGILLALTFASQLIILPASAKVSSVAEHSWKVINGLGLADFSDEEKEEKVTRAEFAGFIANALGVDYKEETSNNPSLFTRAFYTDITNGGFSQEQIDENESIYADVVKNDEFYNAICSLNKLGIMSGDGSGYFHPDNNVKYEEVLKTFVVLAAYNTDAKIPGSWLYGYVKLASELGIILKDVAIGHELTKFELCQIFYKLFNVEMMKMIAIVDDNAVYETEQGVTFLNEILGLYNIEGQLEATSNSTITMPYTSKNNSLRINGINYANKTIEPIGAMLGRRVVAYRTEDYDVVYVTPIDEEEVIVIDAEDFQGYANGKLEYTKNLKTKTIDISGLPVIYNGVSIQNYDEDTFNINYGTITITEESQQNVVIVREYKDLTAHQVNQERMAVYDEVTGYKLDLSEDNNSVFIFDEQGKRTDFSSIGVNDIITYIENGTYKEVYIGGRKIEGTLLSVNPDDYTVKIGDDYYEFSDVLFDNNEIVTLELGSKVKAYINIFDKIYHISVGKRVGEFSGILIRTGLDDSENVFFKVFGEDGNFAIYNAAEKVTFTDSHNNIQKTSGSSIVSLIDNYNGYCVFTVNQNGEISKFQIPLESKEYLRSGEEKVYKKKFSLHINNPYRPSLTSLGSSIFLNADVDMFAVPSDVTDYDHYDKFKMSALGDLEYFTGIAYFKNENKPVPEAIVVKDRHLYSDARFDINDGFKIVKNISESVVEKDGDDVLCREVQLIKYATGDPETMISYYENGVCKLDGVKSLAGGANTFPLNKGDIVYAKSDPQTGEVIDIKLIFSANMEAPAGQTANAGWIPEIGYNSSLGAYSNKFFILKSVYDEWKNQNEYSDFSVFLDSKTNLTDLSTQNPLRISSKGDTLYSNPQFTYHSGNQIMLGYVVDYVDGYAKLTTQDLSAETYNPDATLTVDNKYVGINYEKYVYLAGNTVYLALVEYYDNGIVIRGGYQEDIYTYKNSGKECSRILVSPTGSGNIIINDYRTK